MVDFVDRDEEAEYSQTRLIKSHIYVLRISAAGAVEHLTPPPLLPPPSLPYPAHQQPTKKETNKSDSGSKAVVEFIY